VELQETILRPVADSYTATTTPVRATRVAAPFPQRAAAPHRETALLPKAASVLIASERPLEAAALATWLSADSSIDVVGRHARAEEIASLLVDVQPDTLLVIGDSTNQPLFALAMRHSRLSPRTRLVIVSSEHSARTCAAAASAGASAHIAMTDAPEDLSAAVRGRTSLLANRCVQIAPVTHNAPPLSPRERQVMVHLAQGMSAKEAASALGICPKTVDNHTQRLMKKLGLHSRADLVLFAVREGIIIP